MMQKTYTLTLITCALLCTVLVATADQIVSLAGSTTYDVKNDTLKSYQSKAAHLNTSRSQLYVSGISSLTIGDRKHNQGFWIWGINTIDGTISKFELKSIKNDSIKIFDVQCLQNTNDGGIIAIISTGNDQSILLRINADGDVISINELASEVNVTKIISTGDNKFILIGSKSLKCFAMKINNNGTEIWTKVFDRGENETFVDGIAAKDGGFILIENSGTFEKLFMGESNLFVTIFDSNGNKIDERFLSGRYGSIAQGKDGGFVVVYDKNADSSQDVWVQSYDNLLSPLWSKNVTTIKLGLGKFKAVGLANGNYVVAGSVRGKPWVTYLDSNGTKKWDYLSVSKDFENSIDIVASGDDCYLISTVMRINADKALNNYVKVVKFRPN